MRWKAREGNEAQAVGKSTKGGKKEGENLEEGGRTHKIEPRGSESNALGGQRGAKGEGKGLSGAAKSRQKLQKGTIEQKDTIFV